MAAPGYSKESRAEKRFVPKAESHIDGGGDRGGRGETAVTGTGRNAASLAVGVQLLSVSAGG